MQINSSQAVSAQQALSGQNNTTNKELDRDAFLKLLTTQMQAQDPLNPMDNTEFVAQLSQFTSLERLESISQSMNTLAMSTSSNTSAQMVSFIGKHVTIARPDVTLEAGGTHTPTELSFGQDISEATVSIKDADGKIVRTIELGRREAGPHALEWDGLADDGTPLAPGEYTISVNALNEEGERVDTQVTTQRRVTGVSFEGGLPRLEVEGLEDAATLGEVQEVRDGVS